MKMILTILIALFTLPAFCPVVNVVYLPREAPIEPFKRLIYAVGMVECKMDTTAYNARENAVGFFQIRDIRVRHYNELTGDSLTLQDMYDYYKAEKVFLFFADRIGPYDLERIARNWNGRWELTEGYWKLIQNTMEINDLRDRMNTFGKLVGKTKADEPIITYGYIRGVNGNHIVFEDSAEPELRYKVHNIESFEIEEFKTD
jgi:hypothetical protein